MLTYCNKMTLKNRINILLFGEYYDVIPNTATCNEIGLIHGYDLEQEIESLKNQKRRTAKQLR